MMGIRSKSLRAASICLGLVAGGFAVAAALNTRDSSVPQPIDLRAVDVPAVDVPAVPLPIAATKGNELPKFSGVVGAATRQGKVADFQDSIVSVEVSLGAQPGEVCFFTSIHGGSAKGCASSALIRSGLAFTSFTDHGVTDVIGIVPDDVATVSVGGVSVVVKNNVWHYDGTGKPLNLRLAVASADGLKSAVAGG